MRGQVDENEDHDRPEQPAHQRFGGEEVGEARNRGPLEELKETVAHFVRTRKNPQL